MCLIMQFNALSHPRPFPPISVHDSCIYHRCRCQSECLYSIFLPLLHLSLSDCMLPLTLVNCKSERSRLHHKSEQSYLRVHACLPSRYSHLYISIDPGSWVPIMHKDLFKPKTEHRLMGVRRVWRRTTKTFTHQPPRHSSMALKVRIQMKRILLPPALARDRSP